MGGVEAKGRAAEHARERSNRLAHGCGADGPRRKLRRPPQLVALIKRQRSVDYRSSVRPDPSFRPGLQGPLCAAGTLNVGNSEVDEDRQHMSLWTVTPTNGLE